MNPLSPRSAWLTCGVLAVSVLVVEAAPLLFDGPGFFYATFRFVLLPLACVISALSILASAFRSADSWSRVLLAGAFLVPALFLVLHTRFPTLWLVDGFTP